jgi:DUF4097 and DUF4098 domain-containing protein YvlB
METRRLRRLAVPIAALTLSVLTASACNLELSLQAEAKDQWKRDYPLTAGGTLEIRNTNGRIHLEAVDGDTVSIVADRVVKAATDEAAKQALADFEIRETVSADRIALDSTPPAGITINMSRRVDFTVRLPRTAAVTLRGTNGDIEANGVGGRFEVHVTNGRVVATGLTGAASVDSTNGMVTLEVAQLGPDGIRCETTNGAITVRLPAGAGANLSARVANGRISHEGLDVKIIEESRRRLDGTIGAGGPDIRLQTTNGAIRVARRN